jgi:hypothetical protein
MDPSCYTPPGLIAYLMNLGFMSRDCAQTMASPASFEAVAVGAYLTLFALTCTLETPFYLVALHGSKNSKFKKFLAIVLCNLATHPAVCFLIPYLVSLFHGSYASSLVVGEVFAPLLEGYLLYQIWRVRFARAMTWSIVANLFSWWVGVYFLPYLF